MCTLRSSQLGLFEGAAISVPVPLEATASPWPGQLLLVTASWKLPSEGTPRGLAGAPFPAPQNWILLSAQQPTAPGLSLHL